MTASVIASGKVLARMGSPLIRTSGSGSIPRLNRRRRSLRLVAVRAAPATTGRIELDPGEKSIIPGTAEAFFQLRDADPAVLDRLDTELHSLTRLANERGRCRFAVERLSASTPALMDEALQAALDRAAQSCAPGKHTRMPSGAGHDAQWLARKLPAAMLFVPSIGGISHHWTENTSDEDIALGAQVFTDAILDVLKAETTSTW